MKLRMAKTRRAFTICLVTSQGGHLEQLLRIEDAYRPYRKFLITTRGNVGRPIPGVLEQYEIADINEGRGWRNPFLLVAALVQTLSIFIRKRPNFVISTGAGVAVPAIFWGRIFRVPSLYVESITRITNPSVSGRICAKIASRYLVQHQSLASQGRESRYIGSLYDNI